jgi:glutathione peroxidase
LRGKPVLVVNTASECGYTPQYAGLEALHRKYRDRGLTVIGFPCNQFGAQEPGDAKEIAAFCESRYGVSFTLSEKIEVNGKSAHPLYHWLKEASGSGDIEWNFVKFLIGPDGALLRRYPPRARPEDIAADIEAVLGP